MRAIGLWSNEYWMHSTQLSLGQSFSGFESFSGPLLFSGSSIQTGKSTRTRGVRDAGRIHWSGQMYQGRLEPRCSEVYLLVLGVPWCFSRSCMRLWNVFPVTPKFSSRKPRDYVIEPWVEASKTCSTYQSDVIELWVEVTRVYGAY